MISIKKFKDYLKIKPKKSFEEKLVQFQKFLDSSCSETIEISGIGTFNINQIEINNIINESKVEIKLIEDENKYLSIKIYYRKEKLDLETWSSECFIDGIVSENGKGLSCFIDTNDDFYDKIRQYLIDNKMFSHYYSSDTGPK